MKQCYADFIKYALNERSSIPENFDQIEWAEFFSFCSQHSIVGIVYDGLERANKRIPQQILFEWIGTVEGIRQKNQIINQRVINITKWFNDKGYKSIILKGQANGVMYPKPELRSPGDIDIWVDASDMDIIKLVLKECPHADYSVHHIKMPVFKDVSVEVHYRPIYLMNWFADKKLQRYIDQIRNELFENQIDLIGEKVGALTDEFNAVYQLLHMYAHFFSTRNNFKQLIDYYYLLKRKLNDEEKTHCATLIEQLGIADYAKGIMWIQKEILGLDERLLIMKPDKEVGEIVLNETLRYGTYTNDSVKALVRQSLDNLRLIKFFSVGVIISPLFLIWHQWWKLKMKWKVKKCGTW